MDTRDSYTLLHLLYHRNPFVKTDKTSPILVINFCNFLEVVYFLNGYGIFFRLLVRKFIVQWTLHKGKGKVQCTLVQALRLCRGHTVHRGSRGIVLPFHDHGTRRGWGVSVTPRPLFTPRKVPVHIVHEAGWAPSPVWTGAENPAPTGIRSPDRPIRSQSLYQLSYPAHEHYMKTV